MWWHLLLDVAADVLLAYALLLAVLWVYARRHPDVLTLRDALRLLPDLLRLTGGLARDKTLPVGARAIVLMLLAYLLSPIDLIPDFVPILGYADDAIIVALVLRSVTRRAGPEALSRHWRGSPEGLGVVRKLAGLPDDPGG